MSCTHFQYEFQQGFRCKIIKIVLEVLAIIITTPTASQKLQIRLNLLGFMFSLAVTISNAEEIDIGRFH